jgi:hypothetical protein
MSIQKCDFCGARFNGLIPRLHFGPVGLNQNSRIVGVESEHADILTSFVDLMVLLGSGEILLELII